MAPMQIWSVEARLPIPEANWQPVHIPQDTDDPMTESEADAVITLYKRAMPMREYRKTSHMYDPDGPTEDIPF